MHWETMNTVSYTHLDVYKRQVDMNGLRDLGDQLKGKLGEGVVLLAAVNGEKVNPVSYTHLDVYKRQRYYIRSHCRIRIRCY